jgi:hypothetical protein
MLADEINEDIQEAVYKFGHNCFWDKGSYEVMDVNKWRNAIETLSDEEQVVTLKALSEMSDLAHDLARDIAIEICERSLCEEEADRKVKLFEFFFPNGMY